MDFSTHFDDLPTHQFTTCFPGVKADCEWNRVISDFPADSFQPTRRSERIDSEDIPLHTSPERRRKLDFISDFDVPGSLAEPHKPPRKGSTHSTEYSAPMHNFVVS